QVAGIGDFNGDGNADILWRHAVTGANAVWFLNGTVFVGWGPLAALAGTNWIVAGVFDADGDGNADILWRHTRKGKNAVWFVVGSTVVAWAPLPSATPGWVVAGTSD
ncbi:MAG: FG-GAP repeat domain-containing protein, partial [Planctomycetota bacterium]